MNEENKLKGKIQGLVWLFETMMEAVDIDLDDTEIRTRDSKTNEQLGEMKTLRQILDGYKEDAE